MTSLHTYFLYGLEATTSILIILSFLTLWNVFMFRKRTVRSLSDRELPAVSVLVPARNEEQTITKCVSSLLCQDYPDFEIIVLDDNSTDATREMLQHLPHPPETLRIMQGLELPAGWVGKCYACHQLAQHARGSWLLFTDADTVHSGHAIRDAVELAIARKADLLTLIPRQEMVTFAERLILPLLHFTSFTLLPFFAVEHVRNSKFAIGIGQFMLFRSSAYEAIGGHESVKNNIVEDVWLARKIKEHGLRLRAADGGSIVSCRMYTRWSEVWEGFSKNIFAGFNFSLPAMALAMGMYALLFAAPFVVLAGGLAVHALTRTEVSLLAAQICLNYLVRSVLSVKFKLGVLSTILHPFGILAVVAIAVNSWRWITLGRGARWKGRIYSHTPAGAQAMKEE
jgi:chlorobactene glucosyltransferase